MPRIVGYARVSTKKQILTNQINDLKKANCSEIIAEKVSALAQRPKCEEMIRGLADGDTLVVWKLDRLGRDMFDLITTINDLNKRNVKLISITENIDSTTPQGKIMITVLSLMAEIELSLKKERQEAAKDLARLNGRLGGRPKGILPKNKKNLQVIIDMYLQKEGLNYKFSVAKICDVCQISKGTLYNYLKFKNVPLRGSLF